MYIFPATTVQIPALCADWSGWIEQLWIIRRAILAWTILRTRALHLRTKWSDQLTRQIEIDLSFDIVVFLNVAGCIRGVVGEGMPTYKRPFDKGNLYVKFEIEFPENNFLPLDKLQVRKLVSAAPQT